MSGILTYALHYEGAFNKNSLGAVTEGAKLAKEIGGEAGVVVVGGDDLTDELCQSLGSYGATKVYRANAPEGLGAAGGRRDGQGHLRRGLRLRAVRRRPARASRSAPGSPRA